MKHNELTKLSAFSVIVTLVTLLSLFSVAANADEGKAKLYYFSALESYEKNQYDKAMVALESAKRELGGDNAQLLALKAKILYKQKNYSEAKKALDQFTKHHPSDDLQKEMASYFLKVEKAIENLKLAEKRIAEEELRREELLGSKMDALIHLINSQSHNNSGQLTQLYVSRYRSGEDMDYSRMRQTVSYSYSQSATAFDGFCGLKIHSKPEYGPKEFRRPGGRWELVPLGLMMGGGESIVPILKLSRKNINKAVLGVYIDRNYNGSQVTQIKSNVYILGKYFTNLIFSSRSDANKAKELVDFLAENAGCTKEYYP